MKYIKKGFTFIEVIMVIFITSILLILAINSFSLPKTLIGINNFMNNWQYANKLALNINYFDKNKEYWFKENIHIKFGTNNGDIYYVIFSDQNPFNNTIDGKNEIIKKNGIYLSGISSEENRNTNFPNDKQIDHNLNLTSKYGIYKLKIYYNGSKIASIPDANNTFDILINNQGQVYLNEGDNSNIQIKDKNILTNKLELEFYGNDGKIKKIYIEPYGLIHY